MQETSVRSNYSFYEHNDRSRYILFMHNTDASDYVSRRHYHRAVEIGFVIKGCGGYIVNDKIERISSGEMSYIDSWNVHYFDIARGNETFTLVLSQDYLRTFYDIYGDENSVPYFDQALRDRAVNQHILELLYQWEKDYDQNNVLVNQGYINLILGKLAAGYPIRFRQKNNDLFGLINEMLEYVQQNYKRDITLEDVARALGYGKHYCSRVFHEYIKQDFRNYVNGVRVEAAKRMLIEHPHKQKSEIAFECGFNSMNTFYRTYKRVYGDSPK